MSDTTITPEERAEWRKRLTLLKREVEKKGFRHGCAEMALRLMDALEKTEAQREKDLAHCKFEFDRAEKDEAEVALLNKMCDWLAMHVSGYDDSKKRTVYGAEWKEAARRAVAAGEEPCQK